MKKVQTGNGSIPYISLIAILSISLVVNLPGLAVSPLLSQLVTVFPRATELEIQMLTILPNLFIIPFVLLSGRLAVSDNKIRLVFFGLIVYIVSAVLYFFATSMIALIFISCLLGIGCGIVIPLAAGLIAEHFSGKFRMHQLGIKSGIANFSLIFATFIVGWLGNRGWHLPFVVYLVPLVPLVLLPFAESRFIAKHSSSDSENTHSQSARTKSAIKFTSKESRMQLAKIMLFYFLITYANMAITYYLPFRMQDEKMSETMIGVVTSIFYLAITLFGFSLSTIVKHLRQTTIYASVLSIALGLYISIFLVSVWAYIVGVAMIGAGYGVLQPMLYDKSTHTSVSEAKTTQSLAWLLSANYLAIVLAPFMVDLAADVIGDHSTMFPFLFNGLLMTLVAALSVIFRNSFVFQVNKSYYSDVDFRNPGK